MTKGEPVQTVTGRPLRLPSHMGSRLFVGAVLFFLFLPVVVIVLFSFTTSPRLSLPIEGLTLRWYQTALANPLLAEGLRNSALLACTTAVIAGTLGISFSFGLAKLRRRERGVLLTLSLVPAAVPALVLGVALAVMFNVFMVTPGIRNAAIGHVLIALPFVILTMNARLETFDFTVLEAARDLGASPLRTFRDITLPLIRPSVIGTALLAMALSLDEFVVTFFNVGSDQTLPVVIWGLLRRGIDPSINALATLILFSLIALVVASNRLDRRGGRRW